MVNFFNNDEQGIEGVAGAAQSVVKSVVKSVSGQIGGAGDDLFKQIIDFSNADAQDEEVGTEALGQASGKGRAALKAKTNYNNKAMQQASLSRRQKLLSQGKTPEDVDKLEKLRKLLHDEQVKELFQPKKQQEENVAEKNEREEQQKKQKVQVKQQEEVKKKEDLAVVQKRTGIERRPGAG